MALTQLKTRGIADDAVNTDKLANAINTERTANTAKDLTALSASNLTSGTVPDARFPATLPAASATNLTAVPAANITGTLPAISATNLTKIPAANITGTLPAISATNLTKLPAANITGTLPAISATNLTNVPAANITGTLPAISGANLTNLPASGKILQVLHFRKGDHANATIVGSTSGSNDWNYTGFSPAITPSATSSKILMVGHLSMGGDTTALHIEVMINGSKTSGTANGDSNGSRRTVHTSSFIEYDRNVTCFPISYVFSPNSTSQQTYNFRFNHDSTTSKEIYINRSTNASNNLRQGDAVSHITLMEIAA